uniref:C2H2-type domain-containing protein n=1 Tax=Mastacembelus armatus TaxID=205130 RepID=A0A7N8YEN0_9TELE
HFHTNLGCVASPATTHPRNSETERATKRSRVTRVGTKRIKLRGTSAGAWVRNIGTPLSCKTCGALRGSMRMLIKHAWSHVEDAERLCGVCGVHSASAEELRSHLQRHQKTHSCNICGKSFLSASGIKGHICDICPKAFGMKAQLRAHQKVHTGRDKYHCHICGKSVFDLRSLTRHRATHSGERRYSCEVCGKRFKILGTLRSHEKIHTVRERPYLCHICCKTFVYNCGLTAHMKIHSGERPFVCVICSKGFISNGERKAHIKNCRSGSARKTNSAA